MATFHKLNKFCDARGWSLNDIYGIARLNINLPVEGANTPYEDNVFSHNNCQVNYSILHPGVIKAWHRHKYQDDYFCVIKGMAQVGVYSDEEGAEKVLYRRAQSWYCSHQGRRMARINCGRNGTSWTIISCDQSIQPTETRRGESSP